MKWIGCSDVAGTSLVDDLAPGWCEDPLIPTDEDLPIGIIGCREALDSDMLKRRIRSRGMDPVRVAVVDLEAWEAGDDARLHARMAAGSARVSGLAPTPNENLRVHMPPVSSRRTFLTLRAPSYRVVPRPDRTACGAGDGCRVCVDVCPHGALSWVGGSITHDRLACESCGRCVVACPADAMIHPELVPGRIADQISAYGHAAGRPFGVQFVCGRSAPPPGHTGWLQVEVPCVGMAPPHWLVAPLLLGAGATSLAPCQCGREDDSAERRQDAMAAARSLLVVASIHPNRIVETLDDPPAGPEPSTTEPIDAFSARGAAAIGTLIPTIAWKHPLAKAGTLTISPDICTGCGMCATVCPSDALRVSDGTSLRIDFHAHLCTACGQCADRCPEPGAIAVVAEISGTALSNGSRTLVEHTLARCTRCGDSVAPDATLARLRPNLDEATFRLISSTCLSCRGTRM